VWRCTPVHIRRKLQVLLHTAASDGQAPLRGTFALHARQRSVGPGLPLEGGQTCPSGGSASVLGLGEEGGEPVEIPGLNEALRSARHLRETLPMGIEIRPESPMDELGRRDPFELGQEADRLVIGSVDAQRALVALIGSVSRGLFGGRCRCRSGIAPVHGLRPGAHPRQREGTALAPL
jgi:hypothetical protein